MRCSDIVAAAKSELPGYKLASVSGEELWLDFVCTYLRSDPHAKTSPVFFCITLTISHHIQSHWTYSSLHLGRILVELQSPLGLGGLAIHQGTESQVRILRRIRRVRWIWVRWSLVLLIRHALCTTVCVCCSMPKFIRALLSSRQVWVPTDQRQKTQTHGIVLQ